MTGASSKCLSGVAPLMYVVTSAVITSSGHCAQSLNDAVATQLGWGPTFTEPCGVLLNGAPTANGLTGSLLNLCTRSGPLPGVGPSSSTGGGAAPPTILPPILQQRARGSSTGGASGDGADSAGRGVFVSVRSESLDRRAGPLEDSFESDIERLMIGFDTRLSRQWNAGIAFDYYKHRGAFTDGGDFHNESHGVVAFAGYTPVAELSLQFYAAWARKHYEKTRLASFSDSLTGMTFPIVSGILKGDYAGTEARAGLYAGYDIRLRQITLTPYAGLDWVQWRFDRYSEQGSTTASFNNFILPGVPTGLELAYIGDEQTSFQSSVGVQARTSWTMGSWTVAPRASASWVHEYKNDQRTISVSFVEDSRSQLFTFQTDTPDRNWGEINAGAVALLPIGLQPFVNYRTIFGNTTYRSQTIMVGVRLPF